jgi:hypothetical protein
MAELVTKARTIRDLGAVDVSALLALVRRLSERTWDGEDAIKENAYECFHHTRHVIFRFIHENLDPEKFYSNPSWEIWKPVLLPVMQAAIAPYGFRDPVFPKAMLARLAAGSMIDYHVDGEDSNLRTHKIHVPLITNPRALLLVADDIQHLAAGRAYEVNNVRLHSARNGGDEDRIHFIFEVFEGARRAEAA